jgi:hypothetical protein
MSLNSYVSQVVLKPESGQGDSGAYVLAGSSGDLRTVLEDLLAGLGRVERSSVSSAYVVVGDGSGRHDSVYLGVHVDPNAGRHVPRTRRLWRFYDSDIAGLVALIVFILTMVGAHTVWEWIAVRYASAS